MTRKQKEKQIRVLTNNLLRDAIRGMKDSVDRAIRSGAIDIDSHDDLMTPFLIPRAVLCAVLEHESIRQSYNGTPYGKQVKKSIRNIRYFL